MATAEQAQKLADIAAALAAEKAAIAEEAATRKAAIASAAATEKAAIASNLAAQKAALASRLAQEKSVQQAVLAAQANAAAVGLGFDKRASAERMASAKNEAAIRIASIRAESTAQAAAMRAQEKAVARVQAQQKAAAKPQSGPDVAGNFLSKLLPGSDALLSAAGVAGIAGGLIHSAADKLLSAAEAVIKGAADLAVSAGELAVAQTSKKEVQGAVLGKLGGNYEQTVKAALKLGLNEDEAVAQTKKLLNAKFSSTEIPVLLRIKAGMDLAGLDGDALLKKLETIKLEPKVKSKDIDGLAKLGVDTKAIYQQLAKEMGTTVPVAMAKVKAGAVDSALVIKAIEAQTGKQFGDLADVLGNSLPALFARVKGDFEHLFAFDPAVLDPIKKALKTVATVLEGPVGQALKASLQEVFESISHLFDGISASDVESILKPIAEGFREIAIELRDPKTVEGLKGLARGIKELTPETVQFLAIEIKGLILLLGDLGRAYEALNQDVGEGITGFDLLLPMLGNVTTSIQLLMMLLEELGSLFGDTGGEAQGAGNNLALGFAQGIEAGASEAINAAGEMAAQALAKAKSVLGQQSPSKEFAEVGHFSTEGMAKGLASNDNATQAAGAMAERAVGAARGAAGGAGALGGGSRSSTSVGGLTVVFQIGAGATPQAVAAAKAALPEIEAMLRRVQRDQAEAATGTNG